MTILERHGRKVAALVHDAALSEDPALLDAVSSAAGLALENERLLAELRAQLDEVRDSRARIVEASVTERRRLERNLHDGAQQRLVTLSLHLRMAQETLHDDPPAAEAMLEGVGDDLKQALEELRELARGLHPAVLTDRGLAPALQSLANRSPFPVADRRRSRRSGFPNRSKRPSTTSSRKASPTPRSTPGRPKGSVELSTTPETVVVEIRDNGSGGANLTGGTGLRGLVDRVEALGGELRLQSPRAAERSSGQSCRCAERARAAITRSPPDRQLDAGKGPGARASSGSCLPRRNGRRRRADRHVRPRVSRARRRSRPEPPTPGRGVRAGQLRGEEDEIAEREVLSTFDVDGVVRPAQPTPEASAVRVGGEAGLAAHEHERARQSRRYGQRPNKHAIEIGAGVDTGIDEHRRGGRRSTERVPEHPDVPEVETTREES